MLKIIILSNFYVDIQVYPYGLHLLMNGIKNLERTYTVAIVAHGRFRKVNRSRCLLVKMPRFRILQKKQLNYLNIFNIGIPKSYSKFLNTKNVNDL